jgi:hypothetical protein
MTNTRYFSLSVRALTLIGVACVTSLTFAQSAQFHDRQTRVTSFVTNVNSDDFGDVTVSFKASGLGNTEGLADVVLSVDPSSEASFRCRNSGGNCPEAANKSQLQDTQVEGQFPIRNGQVTGSLTFPAPDAIGFCPGGQDEVLVAVTYVNITISLPDFGISQSFGTLSGGEVGSCPAP